MHPAPVFWHHVFYLVPATRRQWRAFAVALTFNSKTHFVLGLNKAATSSICSTTVIWDWHLHMLLFLYLALATVDGKTTDAVTDAGPMTEAAAGTTRDPIAR
jgi:hypothetical protein